MDLSERRSGNPARHPWELARRDFFFALLRRFDLADAREILDVGSGDAWFARSLAQELGEAVHVTAWDAYYSADDLAQAADSVTLTSVQPAARCDGVMMLDVIEHVPDDLDFVSSIVERNVADEGWVLVSVPAYQLLYTSHDRQLRHYRRYSPRRCRNLLRASGLDLVAEGGVFHSLLLVRFAQAVAAGARHRGGDRRMGARCARHGRGERRVAGGGRPVAAAQSSAHRRGARTELLGAVSQGGPGWLRTPRAPPPRS